MQTAAAHSGAESMVATDQARREAESRALLRILAAQSENANPIVAIAALALIYTMYPRVQLPGLLIWAALAFAMGVFRHLVSKRIRISAAFANEEQLRRYQRLMLAGTACNSLVMGSAFWLFAHDGDLYARMVVTLISMVHMVAVLLYLMPRFTDRIIATAGNVVQGTLFWLGLGTGEPPHWEMLVVYCGMFWCGLVFGREQLRQFRESLRVRNENAELLARLEEERKAVQAALQEARLANEGKNRFLAAASHDLRQPLHALTMFLGTLGFHVSGQDGRRLLGRATDTLRVLEEQFNSLLDLSRFDAGAVNASPRAFHLDELVRRMVEEFRPQAEGKGLRLSLDTVAASACTDPLLLGRLLRNLLDNAVNYTASGEVAVRIQKCGERFEVSVRDSGPGIPPEQQARIFDEYVQLANPGRQRRRGVGLGLAIVKRIDQLLGLRLSLQSGTGTGSCFTIGVPAAAAESAAQIPASATGPDALDFRTQARIWVLDDDPVVLESLQLQLQAWGAQVQTFAEPRPLLEALQEARLSPDWLLTDDMLGDEMSGLDVALACRHASPATRVAIVTGNTEASRMAELRASGLPVIVKPATPERLAALLEFPSVNARQTTTAA